MVDAFPAHTSVMSMRSEKGQEGRSVEYADRDLHDHRKLEVSMRDPEWILQRGMSHGHWAKRGTNGISWLARVALQ